MNAGAAFQRAGVLMAKRPRLFVDDGRDRGTVILNWHSTPEKEFTYVAEAFHTEAKAAVSRLKRNKRLGLHGLPVEDFRAYPVIFLYRHALELSLKAILWRGADMLTLKGKLAVEREKLLKTHDLNWLRIEVERVFDAYDWGWDCGNRHFGSVKDLREVIGEFHKIDAGSFAFRYPVTTKGTPSLPQDFQFNLFHFASVLDALFPALAGAALGAYEEFQEAARQLGEAQEEEARYQAENYEPQEHDPGEDEPWDEY
jgi:hypothetical protein